MEKEAFTQLLMMLLVVSFIMLFILIVVFIMLLFKKKQREKVNIEEIKKTQNIKKPINSNNVQVKTYTTENVKNFMDFDNIKDNMIIQKDGKRLVMVVQCQGVNYDLMNSMEKVAVEHGFIQFLNTLTRPIQIYVQSRKVNLEESVDNYKKRLKGAEAAYNKARIQYDQVQKNSNISEEKAKEIKLEYVRAKNFYEYIRDIINNTERMSLNKNILTKNYYIAIYYYPDNSEDLFKKEELIDMAFSELYTNAQAILRTLSVCGVSGKVLDSTGLADLLYVAYNRDASEVYGIDKAIKAGYDALYTTAPDVVNKKIEELDKEINRKALDLANETIDKVVFKNKKQKELEEKEKHMEDLINGMAKTLIMENEGFISKEIVEQSIQEIDNAKKTKKNIVKKGA